MALFSFRNKIEKHPDTFQFNSISPELRNRLWSCLHSHLFSDTYFRTISGTIQNENQYYFYMAIWDQFLKYPLDRLPQEGYLTKDVLRTYFFEEEQWNKIYDFIEICIHFANSTDSDKFRYCANIVLEQEFAGYRIVGDQITAITDIQEIKSIESALKYHDEISEHLNTALKHLSDKTNPNYRNSIKESISAVESICRKILGDPNITLGAALNKIENSEIIEFHGAEKQAFSNLFGWTSVSGGIRHGMMDSKEIFQEDARFMLTTCTAFINFLRVKADKAGIELK